MASSAGSSKPVKVTIFQQTYTLRTSGDPVELEELAVSLDRLMESIAARTGVNDPAQVAVLAGLHLADRLRALERELAELRRRIEEKSKQFSLLLERVLEPPES